MSLTPERSQELSLLLGEAIQNSRSNGHVPDVLSPNDLAAEICEYTGVLEPEEIEDAAIILQGMLKGGRYVVPVGEA